MSSVTDFDRVQSLLTSISAPLGAAETHALLTGLYCAVGSIDESAWLSYVLGDVDVNSLDVQECRDGVRALGQSVIDALDGDNLGWYPLLPDDEQAMTERSRELGSWSVGFLFGLGLGGLPKDLALSKDSREFLTDLNKLSQIDADAVDDDEADEVAFSELVEYLRTGIFMLHGELVALADASANREQLH